tara:strand:+ start:703 stop:1875 length:1173 start_codon:yes stop_codon:yes gene_type:complete
VPPQCRRSAAAVALIVGAQGMVSAPAMAASSGCSFCSGPSTSIPSSGGSSGGGSEPFVASPTAGTTNALTPQMQINFFDLVALNKRLNNLEIMYRSNSFFGFRSTPLNVGVPYVDASDYLPTTTGIAAGEESAALTDNLHAWTSVSYSETESDFAPAAFESEATAVSVGLDYVLSDFVVLGAMVSYSETDTVSSFNGGGSDAESYTIAPYALFVVDDMFSVDASIGYSSSDMENTRTVGGVVGRGDQDGDTWFLSTGLTAMKWYDNVGVSGRVGWAYSSTDNDAYTDSLGTAFAATDSQLGQVSVGGRVNYFTEYVMPYIGVTYKYDAISEDVITTTPLQPANDSDEVVFDGGLSVYSDGGLSGGISGNYSVLREDYDAWGVTANIGFRF